jgi:hypothetical protein
VLQHHAGQDSTHGFFLCVGKFIDGLKQQRHIVTRAALILSKDQII